MYVYVYMCMYVCMFNNYYSWSLNGLWVNSPGGQGPNGLLPQRPWGHASFSKTQLLGQKNMENGIAIKGLRILYSLQEGNVCHFGFHPLMKTLNGQIDYLKFNYRKVEKQIYGSENIQTWLYIIQSILCGTRILALRVCIKRLLEREYSHTVLVHCTWQWLSDQQTGKSFWSVIAIWTVIWPIESFMCNFYLFHFKDTKLELSWP